MASVTITCQFGPPDDDALEIRTESDLHDLDALVAAAVAALRQAYAETHDVEA